MALDQRLIQKNGLFGASWIAGTNKASLMKVYKFHELNNINVANICNKLCLAINYMRKDFKQLSPKSTFININDDENEKTISYRVIIKLFCGTLHIYKQQVNNLLTSSRDLCKNCKIQSITATKRTSSNFSKKQHAGGASAPKKRCTQFEMDYNELLKEAEELAKFSQRTTLFEETDPNINSTINDIANLSCTHIREITIQEINTEYELPEVDVDEGFGNATLEDLKEFFSLSCDDNNNEEVEESIKKSANKRKASTEHICLSKIARVNNGKNCINEFAFKQHIGNVDAEQYCEESDNCVLKLPTISITNAGSNIAVINKNYSEIHNDKNVCAKNADISYNFNTPMLKKKHNSKLKFIDTLTELSEKVMKAQIGDLNIQTLERPAIISAKQRLQLTANELLTRLNRNSCVSVDFKKRRKVPAKIIQKDYINILSDILGYPINDNLAAEICDNWNKSNYGCRVKNKNQINENLSELPLNNNDSELEFVNYDINNNRTIGFPRSLQEISISDIFDDFSNMEYKPYGIIMKLLNIWRVSNDDKVCVKRIFGTIKTRFDAAVSFSSLLTLAKQGFIKISHNNNSCEMQDIELGLASERLINDILVRE